MVFTSDNHNYQRTFPLKYNDGDSSNPIVADNKQVAHFTENTNNNEGVIYLVTGTAGRSHYQFGGQSPYVVKQDSNNFGFVNIDINGKKLDVNFYPNVGAGKPTYHSVNYKNNSLDQFTISKVS
jgi:hypothetical protein